MPESSPPIQAVLFDLGGTLLHYQTEKRADFRQPTMAGLRNVRAALLQANHTLPPEDQFAQTVDQHIGQAYMATLESLTGGTIETPIRDALTEMGVTIDNTHWATLRTHFYSAIDNVVRPRQGARHTLHTLHQQGFKLGLISNTFWASDLHDRHLAQHDLLDLLPQRIYSADMPHTKPHPSIFQAMFQRLDIAPQNAIYVGDMLDPDINGAQNVGMRAILIHSPYAVQKDDDQTRQLVPDATIDQLPELLDKLPQWR